MSKRKLTNKRRNCVCQPENYKLVAFSPKLNEFRIEGILCDGVIHCADNKSILIHRAILSTASPYFQNVFVNTLNRSESEKKETSVDISSYYFNLLLDYAYTGSCKITAGNVEELLIYADRFEIMGVIQLCCQNLIERLNPKNCFNILKFAKDYFCQGLEKRGKLYIRHNFMEIMSNPEEFNKLSIEEVKEILDDNELNVRRENAVFKAIKSWVNHDPDNRGNRVFSLLCCIRIRQENKESLLKKVLKWKWVSCNQQSCQMIKSIEDFSHPRYPYEVLFAIGGWGVGCPTNYIETYDVRADRWSATGSLDQPPRAYHGVCALGLLVYVIGGFDGTNHFNTMRCFNPVTKIWKERACMYQARCYVSVTVHDGKIYALGGYNGLSRLSSVERYSPEQNQWEMIAPMNKHRSDASAASLEGKVYIIGGLNGLEILTSGEVFDPESNQWTFIMPMTSPRSGVSLVAHRGFLYAIGGYNGVLRLNTCEKFDPAQLTGWEAVANMGVTRSNFAAVVLDGMIFAIGGFNGATTIPTVEYYDARKNRWKQVAPMNLNRSALSACVIPGLPNARDFAWFHRRAPWEGDHSDSATAT